MKVGYISILTLVCCTCSPNQSGRSAPPKAHSASLSQRTVKSMEWSGMPYMEPLSGVDVQVAGSAITLHKRDGALLAHTACGRRIKLNKVGYLRMSTTAGRDALLWPMAVSDEQANTVLDADDNGDGLRSTQRSRPAPGGAALIRATRRGYSLRA